MVAVFAWFRLDLRRRWRSLLVLALLTALAAGTVMTAVAGAKRGSDAIDRLLVQTLPATAVGSSNRAGFDWDVIRALPGVAALAELADTGFEVDGQSPVDFFMPAPIDAEAMRTIERPVVLQGRLADPARADEVVVSPAFERSHGKSVGDTVTIGLYTPEQIDTLQYPFFSFSNEQLEAALAAGVDPDDVLPAAGPVVPATIVGVVRSPLYSEQRRDRPGFVVASAGLYAEYPDNLLGAERLAPVQALVRLDRGEAALPAIRQALADLPVTLIQEGGLSPNVSEIRSVTAFEATSLYVFASVAALAAVVLIGLVVARYAAATLALALAVWPARRAASLPLGTALRAE